MALHGHSNYLRKPCLECSSLVPNHHTTVRKSRDYGKCQHSMHVLSDVYFCDWACYGCLALRGTRIWVPVSLHWSGQLSASRNEDARTETIERGSEAPKESAKGACDDGWGSQMQDWDGEEQDVTKSNGLWPFPAEITAWALYLPVGVLWDDWDLFCQELPLSSCTGGSCIKPPRLSFRFLLQHLRVCKATSVPSCNASLASRG